MPLGSLTALSPARASWHRWRLRPGARARRSRRGARARRGRGGSRRAARALASPSARPPVSGAIVASFRRGANGWTGATSEALVAIETRASTRPPVPRGSCGSPARARVAPRCWAGPRSSRLSARAPPPRPRARSSTCPRACTTGTSSCGTARALWRRAAWCCPTPRSSTTPRTA